MMLHPSMLDMTSSQHLGEISIHLYIYQWLIINIGYQVLMIIMLKLFYVHEARILHTKSCCVINVIMSTFFLLRCIDPIHLKSSSE